MSVPGSDPLDAATAERMLDGDGGGPPRLADLLAQAVAPARAHELVGEDAAVAAFQAARKAPVRRRFGPRRPAWARLVPVRAAVLSLALALAAGGVALAAGIGVIPNPMPGVRVPVSSTPSPTRWTGPSGADSPRTTPSRVPPARSAAFEGLCRAYSAHLKAKPDKASANPMFEVLSEAAGGADKVPAFCDSLLRAAPDNRPPDNPPPGKGSERTPGPPAGQPTPQSGGNGDPKSSKSRPADAASGRP